MGKKIVYIVGLVLLTFLFIAGLWYHNLYKNTEDDTDKQEIVTEIKEEKNISTNEITADEIVNNREITEEYLDSLSFTIENMDSDIEHYIKDMDDFSRKMQEQIYEAGYDIQKVVFIPEIQVNYQNHMIQMYFTQEKESTTFMSATVDYHTQEYVFIFVESR